MGSGLNGLLAILLVVSIQAVAAEAGGGVNYSATVVDEKGQPVEGAVVDYYYDPAPDGDAREGGFEPLLEIAGHTETDDHGRFTVSMSPGMVTAVVKKTGLATTWRTWAALEDAPLEPMVMTAPTILAGVVRDENKQPLAGVEVWVSEARLGELLPLDWRNRLWDRASRQAFSTRTGSDGCFWIEGFPKEATAGLGATKPGMTRRPIADELTYLREQYFQSGNRNITLDLCPAGAVMGNVTELETGRPVAGIRLCLRSRSAFNYGTASSAPIVSGTDGEFCVTDLQPGDYNLECLLPGFTPDWVGDSEYFKVKVTVAAGETNGNVQYHVTKGGVAEVAVVNANDLKPIAGVAVTAGWGRRAVYTDSNGVARLRLPAGNNRVTLLKKGWLLQNSQISIQPGQPNFTVIQMAPPRKIVGTVRDATGIPVAGAVVSFHPGTYPGLPYYAEVRTDELGRYELTMKEEARLSGVWDGGAMAPTNLIVARCLERNLVATKEFCGLNEFPTKVNFVLQPGLTLSGLVKDTDGRPVSDAMVSLRFYSFGSRLRVDPPLARTEETGRFRIPALPRGWNYYFDYGVTKKGYKPTGGLKDGGLDHEPL